MKMQEKMNHAIESIVRINESDFRELSRFIDKEIAKCIQFKKKKDS